MKRNSSKKSIFEFNHIDKSLSEEQIETTFINITIKNIGAIKNLINLINF